jgi:Putative Flp pilus-assembly TadE/G-like
MPATAPPRKGSAFSARWRALWRAFRRDRSANAALTFGLAAPVLFGMVAVAVDYSRAAAGKSKLQAVADGAALYAAREFQMAQSKPEVIVAAALNYARSQAPDAQANAIADPSSYTVNVVLEKHYELTIGKAVFGGDMHVRVNATARMTGGLPLCLIGLEPVGPRAITLQTSARMTAPSCLVYSNSINPYGLVSEDAAVLQAGYICSAGGRVKTTDTNYSPQPMTDCPVIPDPLAARQPPPDGPCNHLLKVVSGEVAALSPGVYCGGLTVTNGAEVTLKPGIYTIKGPLLVNGGATLKGENVALYMKGLLSSLIFETASIIRLTAPKDGPLAGILIYDDPTGALAPYKSLKHDKLGKSPREHVILSDDARVLLGTIYMPKGRLIIDATKPVADRSAYTVMVLQQLDLYEGPNLHLNSDYSASDIPVPKGVGPYGGKTMLTN